MVARSFSGSTPGPVEPTSQPSASSSTVASRMACGLRPDGDLSTRRNAPCFHKGPADDVAGFEESGQGCACNAIFNMFMVLVLC